MSDRSRWSIPALLFALAAAPAVLVGALGKTMVMPPAPVHFGVVLAAAGIAACAAAALTRAGWRAADGRAMLLGTAFSTMTALLAVHGLTTPDVLVGKNGTDRLRRRPRHPGRHRDPRADRAAGAAPHAARKRAARPPGLLGPSVIAPRRDRPRLPDARPQRPDRRLRRRLRAARLRPLLLRAAHPPRDAHVLALAPPGRPAGRRRLHLAGRLARRAARDRPDDARLLRSATGSSSPPSR